MLRPNLRSARCLAPPAHRGVSQLAPFARSRNPRSSGRAPALLSRPRADRVLPPAVSTRPVAKSESRRRMQVPHRHGAGALSGLAKSRETAIQPTERLQEEPAISPRKHQAPPQIPPPSPPPTAPPRSQIIREDIGDCTRCALHKGRNKIVFADG